MEIKKTLKDLINIIGSKWNKSEYNHIYLYIRLMTHLISDNLNSALV